MFVAFKILKVFVLPPTLIAFGMILTLFFLYRRRIRVAKVLLCSTFVLYYLLSIEPTAFLLQRSLSSGIASPPITLEILKDNLPEAIVILAGGANPKDEGHPFPELAGASWRRLWRGLEVYRELGGKVPILYSGDSGDPFGTPSGEAALAREYAVKMGIPEESFLIETSSRTTTESGVAIKQILDEKFLQFSKHQVILVTSSWHLPRSIKVLEREGISAIPAPADFPTSTKFTLDPLSFMPAIEYFNASYLAIHEWMGRGAYWVLDGL